ncbi:hypothetical protein [Bradyrhizobium sp. RP6]|uniref:hypothetical protein n=1 Tax=Bradyrhizobium sp. RP6 TaxID=2489596 RepID=UPI000F522B75|nr:hypothetical protein [Bradyrhizobium sp. RP6]RQH12661.1 hypothetical protein EHH60_14310 [Bradyrhizobium sp. RP6]
MSARPRVCVVTKNGDSRILEKLDPHLRQILAESVDQPDPRPLTVIVGLQSAADPRQMNELRAAGLRARSTMGDIITGTILSTDLVRIAEHPLVTTIEASRPMHPNKPE